MSLSKRVWRCGKARLSGMSAISRPKLCDVFMRLAGGFPDDVFS